MACASCPDEMAATENSCGVEAVNEEYSPDAMQDLQEDHQDMFGGIF